jgi:hypothetical protein
MAILKQNGASGKILRNNDGKALKQNYNFGNILKTGYDQGSNYYVVRDLDLSTPITFLMHIKRNYTTTDIAPLNLISDTGGSQYFMFRQSAGSKANGAYCLGTYGTVNTQTNTYTVAVSENTYSFQIESGSELSGNGGLGFTSQNFVSKLDDIEADGFTEFRFPKLYSSNYGLDGYGDILIFSRIITEEELLYYRNNGLGNEPLNTYGLIAKFNFSEFEIIDDTYVGFRNSIQDKYHIEFKNPPDGTVAEQLEYANTNLIGIW